MSFIGRIRNLERSAFTQGRCVECGLRREERRPIALERIPEGAEAVCATCRQARWVVIKVVYDGDEEGEGTSVGYEM
ncbi:MAG: hypothetical protein M3N00_02265 [Actinomycetota bacterium]|nr:hypothetical protein [Actinomycetota bacterium]